MSTPTPSIQDAPRGLPSLTEPSTSIPPGVDPERRNRNASLQLRLSHSRVSGMTIHKPPTLTVVRQKRSNIGSSITHPGSTQLTLNLERERMRSLQTYVHNTPTVVELGRKSSTKTTNTKLKITNHIATVQNAEEQATPPVIKPAKESGVALSVPVPELKSPSKIPAETTRKSWVLFKKDLTAPPKKPDDKLPSLGPLSITNLDEFLEKSKQQFETLYKEKTTYDCNLSHFKLMKTLGKGSFGKVVLAQFKDDNSFCAIKIMNKQEVIKKKQVMYVMSEKRILQALNFPFTINLRRFFADAQHLYFVMPYVSGGDLSHFLFKHKSLKENQAQFYVGQLVLALEYLHFMGLIHRDIKPVNIVIDALGYLRVADFGQCIRVVPKDKTWTMTGTPEYMAPEIIMGKGYDCAVDWWSLGVVTFEICAGFRPFKSETVEKVYKLVLNGKYNFPDHFSSKLKALISKLLESAPSRRIAKDPRERASIIKSFLWLKDTDWLALLNRTIPPPLVPLVSKGHHAHENEITNKEHNKV